MYRSAGEKKARKSYMFFRKDNLLIKVERWKDKTSIHLKTNGWSEFPENQVRHLEGEVTEIGDYQDTEGLILARQSPKVTSFMQSQPIAQDESGPSLSESTRSRDASKRRANATTSWRYFGHDQKFSVVRVPSDITLAGPHVVEVTAHIRESDTVPSHYSKDDAETFLYNPVGRTRDEIEHHRAIIERHTPMLPPPLPRAT